jgi:tetratricopeptide (TPR) repeat protein
MRIELRSLHRKVLLAAVCLIFAGTYLYSGLRMYLAAHLAANSDSPSLQRAIQLEPSNAEYHYFLGLHLALFGQNPEAGISDYEAAVRLNPYVARYWLDLAGAYQVLGRTSEQQQAIERAMQTDPTSPHVAWEAGNFFLIQGDPGRALRQFQVVLANDPERADAALLLCWRATENANEILQLLPRKSDLYFSFLRLLINKQQIAAAEIVWNGLVALNQPFSPKLAFPYFRLLLDHHEVEAAQNAWQQVATLDPSLRPYLPSAANLVVNGGFEETVLNGGFDWWYLARPHAAVAIDSNDPHRGTHSLSVIFDGWSTPDAGIFQFVRVKPNQDYEFSAEYKTERLESASGPRFAITDAYTNESYVLTDDFLNDNPWHEVTAEFKTGADTNLLLLRVVREPAKPLIRGKFWIDDVRLVEK